MSAILFHTILPVLPVVAALVYSSVDIAIAYFIAKKCSISIEVDSHGQKGQALSGNIYTKGRIPFGGIIVRMKVTNNLTEESFFQDIHIAGKETKMGFELSSQYCGNIELAAERFFFFDTLKIFRLSMASDIKEQCLILPNVFPQHIHLRDGWSYDMESLEYSKVKPGEDMSEIFDIREYEKGDSLKRIHWKLTGKYEKLMVMRPSYPMDNRTALVYDNICLDKTQASCEQIDKAVSAAVTTSYSLISNEIRHTLCWYDTQSKDLVSFEIDNKDDIYTILPLFLGCGLGDKREDYNSLNGFEEYSHVIYVGPKGCALDMEVAKGQTVTLITVDEEARSDQIVNGVLKIVTCPQTVEKDLENLYI